MEIASKITNRIRSLFGEKSAVQTTERCCFTFSSSIYSFIHLNTLKDAITVINEAYKQVDKSDTEALFINHTQKTFALGRIPVYWLLRPDEYQIFLIESLPVEKNELAEALNWRVRSLVTQPIEETIIDHFTMPAKKNLT